LQRADELLPALVAQIPEAQAAVNRELGELGAIVFDVRVQADGISSYTCGFPEGDREGKLFRVFKEGSAIVYPAPNPSIERTDLSRLRRLKSAAHVER
jgi:hypothetical protein